MDIKEFKEGMVNHLNESFRTNASYYEEDIITLETELRMINANDMDWYVFLCQDLMLENIPATFEYCDTTVDELCDELFNNNF